MLQALIYISLKHAKGPTEIPEVLAKTAISEMQQHALDERICRARKECSKQGVNVVLPPNSAVSCVTKHILPLTSLAPNWGKHRPLSGTNESPRWCPALSCSPFLLLWAELDLPWDGMWRTWRLCFETLPMRADARLCCSHLTSSSDNVFVLLQQHGFVFPRNTIYCCWWL